MVLDQKRVACPLQEEADAVPKDEEADVVLKDEEADVVLKDEEADVVLKDELADTVPRDEKADAVLKDEEADTVPKDEEACGEKRHRCDQCGKSFKQKSTLTQHQRLHTGENLLFCPMCDKKCTTKTQLIQHVRVHTGEKPFTCDQCGKRFGLKANLKTHARVHSAGKQYPCDQCGSSFKDKTTLKQHSLVHTGNQDFSCDKCGQSVGQVSHLQTQLTHNGEKTHFCDRCGFLDKTQSPQTSPQQSAVPGSNKQLPRTLKLKMIDAHKAGGGYKKIAKQYQVPISSVRNVIRKWKLTGTVEVKARSGRPSKISARTACSIAGKVIENPCLSASSLQEDLADTGVVVHRSTVKRCLYKYGLRGRVFRRKPLLSSSLPKSESEAFK